MFEKVNLENALKKERETRVGSGEEKVLAGFKALFEADWERDQRLKNTLSHGYDASNLPPAENFPADRIYDLSAIRSICLKYRLRFLKSELFQGEIPRKAFSEIKKTERLIGRDLNAFMMVAPTSMFKLEDANKDPLLFAPLNDGRFYLIDKWGNDMSWYRAAAAWPLKTPIHLLLTIITVAACISLVLPSDFLSAKAVGYFNYFRLLAFFLSAIMISGLVSYFWFVLFRKFSVQAWNSKHFN